MAFLQDILYKVPIVEVRGSTAMNCNDFHFDSRQVQSGDVFMALRGTQTDGHAFISQAILQGAAAIVCEVIPEVAPDNVTWIVVKDTSIALAHMAAAYYGNPADDIQVIGITGTNGKTTTATLLYSLAMDMGYPAGLLSTVQICINGTQLPATHTTPDAKSLHGHLSMMRDAGCRFCFMEVSSHALVQNRVWGLPFAGAVFTNITHDHLDYHGSFSEYVKAKQILFNQLRAGAFALTNSDDRNGMIMVQNTKAKVYTYSMRRMSDFQGRLLENTPDGLLLQLNGKEVWSKLRGSFNAYNILAVYGVAHQLDLQEEEVFVSLSKLDGVSGRFETFTYPGNITAIVDYAHTPDALKNILENVSQMIQEQGSIITVVGCGGNRDAAKRPEMAKIACEYSAQVILTSDNPRFEDPEEIIRQMDAGVPVVHRKKVLRITNRREAIFTACKLAKPNDIIVVAGKGHETYQEIEGVKHAFDDRLVLNEFYKEI
jgi:UDP-N-acetylmuramoyl-L-alanyl-D-glutamate--2,6-diaminopimelate ligase